MDKQEIFDKIVEICADVCKVEINEITSQCRKTDVVTARSIAIFWCYSAGFSVESLLRCADLNNHQSIDSIRAKFEEYWVDRFAYHMLVKEAGKRLLDFAHSIGEDFDVQKPIRRMSEITGKY